MEIEIFSGYAGIQPGRRKVVQVGLDWYLIRYRGRMLYVPMSATIPNRKLIFTRASK